MVKVSICVGSACHMKGAYATTQMFQEAIAQAGIQDKVELSASFCMGECINGPCVRINGVKFHQVDQERVQSLVEEEILPLTK
ncbi:MAG: (2Fe-2S) ferredoxin domain-containing protein [Clostridia bacterium]|nr:(2Fe-2S) ferredoxin domain-containing protein [Clostridia bacterium]